MKKLVSLLFILAMILAGCGSSKKQLEKGNYEAALDKAVRQLRKDSRDSKQAAVLDRSFKLLNDQDNERLRFLKLEGKPANWDEIYLINKRLSDRQSMVRTVTPINLNGQSIEYPYMDYMPEMVAAKKKSADFYFGHGNELMKVGTKDSYRQAFYEFARAKEYVGDYEGIDSRIEESKFRGMSRVLITLQNTSAIQFPKEFEQDLLSIDLPRLNSEWVEYHTEDLGGNTQFDYYENVVVRTIGVSPDQSMQRDSVIKRQVEDGYSYELDKNGNVRKDTAGNDIKTKKYKTLQCALVETVQTKACQIDGTVEVIQMNPNKVVKKDPIGARSAFENVSARAIGDAGALNAYQLEKTKTQVVPFPSDEEMVLRCSESLKQAINGAVQNNRRFIN
jgi:hypothetical protein